jgi:hypothetical protein
MLHQRTVCDIIISIIHPIHNMESPKCIYYVLEPTAFHCLFKKILHPFLLCVCCRDGFTLIEVSPLTQDSNPKQIPLDRCDIDKCNCKGTQYVLIKKRSQGVRQVRKPNVKYPTVQANRGTPHHIVSYI